MSIKPSIWPLILFLHLHLPSSALFSFCVGEEQIAGMPVFFFMLLFLFSKGEMCRGKGSKVLCVCVWGVFCLIWPLFKHSRGVCAGAKRGVSSCSFCHCFFPPSIGWCAGAAMGVFFFILPLLFPPFLQFEVCRGSCNHLQFCNRNHSDCSFAVFFSIWPLFCYPFQ